MSENTGEGRFKELVQYETALRMLRKASPKQRKKIISNAPDVFIFLLCACCINVLNGFIELSPQQRQKLTLHKKNLRTLANRSSAISLEKRQKILMNEGGFLPTLLTQIQYFLETSPEYQNIKNTTLKAINKIENDK